MARKETSRNLGDQGFLGPSNLGPSSPEAQQGHVGPLDPVGMVRNPRSLDKLGYLPEGRPSAPPRSATKRERGY